MAEFFEAVMAAYEEISQISPQTLRGVLRMRGKIRKLLQLKAG